MRKGLFLPVALALVLGACGGDGDDGIGPPPGGDPNVSLAIGEVVRVTGGSQLAEVTPEEGGGTYIFIPANANATPDVRESYRVALSGGSANSISLDAQASASLAVGTPDPRYALQDDFEASVRQRERSTLDVGALRSRSRTAVRAGSAGMNMAVLSANPNVGDAMTLRIPDAEAGNLCDNFITINATVKAVSTRAVIVQDNASPAGGFTATDFQEIATEFDNLIYNTDVTYFGQPTDIDANGGRIVILYTPEVNKLTPSNSTGFVGGFFWAGDLFPRSDPDPDVACSQSNEAEMFYLLVPDPQGTINSNVRTTAQVRQGTRGTIAHELQHMINSGRRLYVTNATAFEAVWLDEALSHLAEDVVGRALFGYAEFRNLTFQDITARGNADFNAFFFQNLARFRFWMQRPDTSAATSKNADDELAYRGAAWALLRYTADHYASGGVPTFTRALVDASEISVANLTARAGVPFDSLMVGWMVANYADDLGIVGLSPKFTYRSWDMRSAMSGINGGAYPLRVQNITPGFEGTLSLLSATGAYYRRATSGAPGTFSMTNASGGPLTAAGARLYLLRID